MENDPLLMGRGLHVDDSTTNVTTGMNNVKVEFKPTSVKVSGPTRLVMYLRKRIHQSLVQYIAVKDSPQEKSVLELVDTLAEESDDIDACSDLDQSKLDEEMDSRSTIFSSKCKSRNVMICHFTTAMLKLMILSWIRYMTGKRLTYYRLSTFSHLNSIWMQIWM